MIFPYNAKPSGQKSDISIPIVPASGEGRPSANNVIQTTNPTIPANMAPLLLKQYL
ncbi:MAG: hypothetical protein ACTSVZ_05590 [Promethearchaeota archaeon]